jgi:glycosyltransferase involved in cell wall biosynthesis
MAKLALSATIVARNEELKIKKCLSSIAPLVDEIIFIHDGKCEDTTLEIAKEYTDRIFTRDYVGEAEPHRKFAIAQARHNWILQIDADEFLTKEMAKILPRLVKNKNISGYSFRWNVSYADEKPRYNHKLALYQKDHIRLFHGIPHEVVSLEGKIKPLDNIELGHNRTRSREKTRHNTQQWPIIHGKYLEEYKFRRFPSLLLPFGYLFYPLLGTIISLFRGTIALTEIFSCFDYHLRLWHSFSRHRLKRVLGKRQ